jgi:GH24 family phage-related lysozyme (muramidase)
MVLSRRQQDHDTVQLITDITSLLRFEEGEKLFVYDDFNGKPITKGSRVYGNPTIGVGRALNVSGITQAESTQLLTNDIAKWYTAFPDPWFTALDTVRRAAIVSMAHAMGAQGVRDFSDMIAALQAQDWKAARDAVLLSKWAGEAPARATRCANMLWTGVYPIV